ncbi:hypothetical protein ABIB40_001835 [Pedobacter sp. UYP30]|uniref:hypothetical protein n=1 Tax=Pedobacter sp. UYP30 TaxID=1756400 RepID=UPI00339379A4
MKNLFIILVSLLTITGSSLYAQTKKPVKKAKTTKTIHTTKKPIRKSNTSTSPSKIVKTPVSPVVDTKPNAFASSGKQTKSTPAKNGYKTAVGLKFIYGVSLTGKFFIKDDAAIEAIVRYNGAGGFGSNIALTALYEYHGDIKGVDGLRWYIGGGAFANYFSWKDIDAPSVTTYGVSAVAGLEYKFAKLPIAISADWLPGYVISNNIGFSAENGGVGIKYTF